MCALSMKLKYTDSVLHMKIKSNDVTVRIWNYRDIFALELWSPIEYYVFIYDSITPKCIRLCVNKNIMEYSLNRVWW